MRALFAGQVILLTGASEGIGRALALRLAAAGAALSLVARNAERLEQLARECRALGSQAQAIAADLANSEDCERCVRETLASFGRLDTLVNNAGITMWSRFEAIADTAVFEHVMRVNYLSAVHLTRAALPALRESRGLIVAVASLAGLNGVPERTAYAASKHAMIGFFDSLRIELRDSGVAVSVIAPDFVVSQIHKRALGPDGQALGHSPLHHPSIQTAEQCAAQIERAMHKRQRLLITSLRGRIGRFLKPFAPSLLDRMAARAIRLRR